MSYKLLDCNRKNILGLPSGAVHLWFCYYMHESEGQESWLSLSKLESITGMGRQKIIRWQRYLREHGWLVETGDVAANKYAEPSVGSWQVPVVRVDDPIKPPSMKITPQCENHTPVGISYQYENHPQGLLVIGSSSGSGYVSSSQYNSRCGVLVELPTNTNNTTPKTSNSSTKPKVAGDGTPWPDNFDSWTNVQRTTWLDDHKTPLGVSVKSKPTAPTAKPTTNNHTKPPCLHCGTVPDAFGCDCI